MRNEEHEEQIPPPPALPIFFFFFEFFPSKLEFCTRDLEMAGSVFTVGKRGTVWLAIWSYGVKEGTSFVIPPLTEYHVRTKF